jgi:hypothetical protein
VNHGKTENGSVPLHPRDLGRPRQKPTFAFGIIIRLDRLFAAGGPEPRKIRRGYRHFLRESSHPMIRVGRALHGITWGIGPSALKSPPFLVGAARHWVKTVNHGKTENGSVPLHPRDLGRPRQKPTFAAANIIRPGSVIHGGRPGTA